MINFDSIKQLYQGLKRAVMRFPMATAVSVLGTIIGIVLIHSDEPFFLPSILMTIALGFPLYISTVLIAERLSWGATKKFVVDIAVIGFLIAYFFWLPRDIFTAEYAFIIRYIMWAIGFVLLVTFIPFVKHSDERIIPTFWFYGKALFFAVALTALWAGALQLGLSIAIGSVDFLFNLDINDKRYGELAAVVFGIFSTTFFLSRIPKNPCDSATDHIFPKELKLFAQYVLTPLVTLYFLILYAYVARILILWEWPEGTLAYMILGFSMLGVATYISLYPLREHVSWIRKAGTAFYVVLIPQVGMLFWALWFRLSQYGFTENRYFVFVFGIWLVAMALYFLISKKKDIRIVPITLFVIAFLSSFGPWGAFAVSEKSQTNRLQGLLTKNNLLVEGRVVVAEDTVSPEDTREISEIVKYLYNTHGLDALQPWFDADLEALEHTAETEYDVSPVVPEMIVEDLIGIEYIAYRWVDHTENEYFHFYTDTYDAHQEAITLSPYEHLVTYSGNRSSTTIDGNEYVFSITDEHFMVKKNEHIIATANLHDFLDTLIAQQSYNATVDTEHMSVDFAFDDISFALHFSRLNGEIYDDTYTIDGSAAIILFTIH